VFCCSPVTLNRDKVEEYPVLTQVELFREYSTVNPVIPLVLSSQSKEMSWLVVEDAVASRNPTLNPVGVSGGVDVDRVANPLVKLNVVFSAETLKSYVVFGASPVTCRDDVVPE
jgi:hypothetical protein